MRKVCCYCGKVLDPGNSDDEPTSHGACERCTSIELAKIRSMKMDRADVAASAHVQK